MEGSQDRIPAQAPAESPRARAVPFWPHAILAVAAVVLLGALATGKIGVVGVQIALLALILAWVLALRADVFTAAVIIFTQLLIDYYQLIAMPKGFPFVSLLMTVILLALVCGTHWRERLRDALPELWIWAVFIVLIALAIPRSYDVKDAIIYALNIAVTACAAWLVGTLVITDRARLRQLVTWLTLIGTCIAVHTIIEARTGIFLLATPHLRTYLASENFFLLDVGGTHRAGSLLFNPDSNGAFLALMLFLPAGLLFSATLWRVRVLCALAMIAIILALLFTYTTAAWVAAAVGVVVFVLLAGRGWARVGFFALVIVATGGVFLALPRQMDLLIKHATGPNNLTLRKGAWQTALNIIHAYPLTGIGLGTGTPYVIRDAPFRSKLEFTILTHPHNSYLELAALAGVPVLLVFLVLLGRWVLGALRNYRLADRQYRPLIAGVIAALTALSVHAFADATWTLPPLVPLGWMLAGAISSRALRRDLERAARHDAAAPATTAAEPVPAQRQWIMWS